MPTYHCDRCGACCQGHLIVEADYLDARREEKLLKHSGDPWADGKSPEQLLNALEEDGRCLLLAAGTACPCRFLADDNRCSIYPTRPNACVAMEAGDEQCQSARRAAGLPPLAPVTGEAEKRSPLSPSH